MSVMTDGRVPTSRPQTTLDDFKIGRPVRAQTWLDYALLAHWVSGRGQVIVPQHRAAILVGDTTETFRYYVPSSGRAMQRVWALDLRPTDDVPAVGEIQIGSKIQGVFLDFQNQAHVVWFLEEGLTPSTGEDHLTIDITADTTVGSMIRVESVACWEVPRAALDRTITDCGVSLDSLFPRRPILDDESSPRELSVPAVAESIWRMTCADVMSIAGVRRIGHIARWGMELEVGSTSPASLTIAPYRVLPRKVGPSDTTKTLRCRIYRENDATGGEWRVVTGSGGASAWQAISGSGYSWSSAIDVDVKCEDPTTTNGVRGGSYDTLNFQVRVTTGQVNVKGWTAYEYT